MSEYHPPSEVQQQQSASEEESYEPTPRWQKLAATGAHFVYLGILAVIGGWFLARLFGSGHEELDLETLSSAEATLELRGVNEERDLAATLGEMYGFREHGEKLTETYLRDMGLSPEGRQLLELRVVNYSSEHALPISDRDGLVVLRTKSGKRVSSRELPRRSNDELTNLRLIQHRAEGELPPETQRRFWVLFNQPVDLEDVREATLRLDDGQELTLELGAK